MLKFQHSLNKMSDATMEWNAKHTVLFIVVENNFLCLKQAHI